jgi:RNA polymerase sigma-70 factor, ECF subfamily
MLGHVTTTSCGIRWAFSNTVVSANLPGACVSFTEDADDDVVLVERCLRGDMAAFRPLVERYERVLFTVALRMLGDYDEAADAVQNAFVRGYQKLKTYDHNHKFFSWLYRILVNECLNVKRARRVQVSLEVSLPAPDDTYRTVEQAQIRAAVQSALMRLPAPYREVVVLRHFAGLSYHEIAETLDVPEKTIKSRLYEARQQLGDILQCWRAER